MALPALKQPAYSGTQGPASSVRGPAVPTIFGVQKMLRDLLGVDVQARPTQRLLDAAGASSCIYTRTDGVMGAGALCDLSFIVTVGAALSMIPGGVAAEALRAGRPTDTIEENWAEVMNICSSLWNALHAAHVTLGEHFIPPRKPPPDFALAVRQSKTRIDMELAVPGYPTGRLSLLTFNLF